MSGLFIAFCILYLTETSPQHLRAAVVSTFQMYLVVGQIIGSVVDNYTAVRFDRLSYQIPLIVLYAIPVCFTILVLWLPDTPRWLLQKDRVEDAKAALYKLYGPRTPDNIISEQLADIQAAIKAEEAQGIKFIDLFRGTDLVRFIEKWWLTSSVGHSFPLRQDYFKPDRVSFSSPSSQHSSSL